MPATYSICIYLQNLALNDSITTIESAALLIENKEKQKTNPSICDHFSYKIHVSRAARTLNSIAPQHSDHCNSLAYCVLHHTARSNELILFLLLPPSSSSLPPPTNFLFFVLFINNSLPGHDIHSNKS